MAPGLAAGVGAVFPAVVCLKFLAPVHPDGEKARVVDPRHGAGMISKEINDR